MYDPYHHTAPEKGSLNLKREPVETVGLSLFVITHNPKTFGQPQCLWSAFGFSGSDVYLRDTGNLITIW